MFDALSIPAYRYLIASLFFSFFGMQMQQVGRGLVAYEIGGTSGAIAIVSLGVGLPMLVFSLIGGAVADRIEKRFMIMATQGAMAILAVALAVLIETDRISLLLLFLTGVIQGVVFSFSGPARQAFIPEVVGETRIMNAIALNQSVMNLSRIGGPALAGALVAVPWIDIEGLFYLQAAMNVLALLAIFFLPPSQESSTGAFTGEEAAERPFRRYGRRPGESMWAGLKEGLRYVKASPILTTLLVMGLVPSLIGLSYITFLPVFAKDVYGDGIGRNAGALGVMMTMSGVGALAGSLTVASLSDFPHKAMLQLAIGVGYGLSLLFFGLQSGLLMGLVGLVLVGFMSSFFQALNSTLIMGASDRRYHGRVMSINMMTFGLMPVGTLPIGFLADVIGEATVGPWTLDGIQVAQALAGGLIVLFIVVMTLRNPEYRKLGQHDLERTASLAAQRVEEQNRLAVGAR
jgi:MFS family permease